MLNFTINNHDCTGCGVCIAVCSVKCISFVSDKEGFSYPVADSRCINCGKCEKVCPVINNQEYNPKDFNQFCVAGRHKDDRVWEKSASGGAFTAICESYCNNDDVIFGAKFEGIRVVHDYIRFSDKIDCFRKSKYVQSDMGESYIQIKELLEKNHKIIFSGTPCQVAGVRNFLGRDYENLLCIDLICHGVGSPGIFKRYVESLEVKHSSNVKSFTFRSKKAKMGRLLQYVIVIEFENGKRIENENDLYNTAFIQALLIRPSCGKCRFANLNRVGDLTIGDFKKKHELLPKAKGIDNFSIIIINSEKGQKVFEQLDNFMEIYPVNFTDVIKTNPPLTAATKLNKNREAFFQDLEKVDSIEETLKRYITSPKLYKRIWKYIPDRVRGAIKRRIKWKR